MQRNLVTRRKMCIRDRSSPGWSLITVWRAVLRTPVLSLLQILPNIPAISHLRSRWFRQQESAMSWVIRYHGRPAWLWITIGAIPPVTVIINLLKWSSTCWLSAVSYTHLDVTIQAQILDLMRDLQKKIKTSIIIITHNLGVVANIADRVAVMYGGKLVETGDVEDIFHNPCHEYTKGPVSYTHLDVYKRQFLTLLPPMFSCSSTLQSVFCLMYWIL